MRNREGVETDQVDTKCAQSSCVGKRGCPSHSFKMVDCLPSLRNILLQNNIVEKLLTNE